MGVNANDVKIGMLVRVGDLGLTSGFRVMGYYLTPRKKGVVGIVRGMELVGHEGEMWYVQHQGVEDIGVYSHTELSPEPSHMTRMQLISDT